MVRGLCPDIFEGGRPEKQNKQTSKRYANFVIYAKIGALLVGGNYLSSSIDILQEICIVENEKA